MNFRVVPRLAAACALSVLLTAEGSAIGETETKRTERVRLAIEGQEAGQATMCGKGRPTTHADHQQPLNAVAEIARPRQMTRARVVVAGCQDGAWRRVRSQSFLPSRRYQLPLDTSLVGDYRLRALATDRRGRTHRSRFAYLRVISPTSLTARLETSEPGAGITYSPVSPVYAHPGQTMMRGELSSPALDCVDDRLLDVYRTDSGPERQVASGRSYINGEYEIDLGPTSQPASGSYYVYAPRRGSCAEAKSPVVSGE
jgi:hypothetical protein